jgi:hypothetical protein
MTGGVSVSNHHEPQSIDCVRAKEQSMIVSIYEKFNEEEALPSYSWRAPKRDFLRLYNM